MDDQIFVGGGGKANRFVKVPDAFRKRALKGAKQWLGAIQFTQLTDVG